jgi:hypothetical protein
LQCNIYTVLMRVSTSTSEAYRVDSISP